MASMDLEKVRILVVGDSGVGKSSLVQLICHNQPMLNAGWTIGASVEVKIHDYKEGTPSQKSYFAEFWDIGGSVNHATSRHIFYNPVHGIVLVHDLTNRKSHSNLRRWLSEVLNKDTSNNGSSRHYSTGDYDPEQFAGSHIPVLVIGTKQDQLDSRRQNINQTSSIAEECGADEINLDCTQARHLAPGSTNAVKLSRFLDKVIERRYFARDSGGSQAGPPQERRRISRQQFTMKNAHVD